MQGLVGDDLHYLGLVEGGLHGHVHVEDCPVVDYSFHQVDIEAADLEHHHLDFICLGDVILSAVRGKRDLNLQKKGE